jgi:uncharacterized protein GlcG (DUF336 family)
MALIRKLTLVSITALAATAAVATYATQASSASPKEHGSSDPHVVVQHKVISLASAQKLANAAQAACTKRGFVVTVAVVDPDGVDVLVQRADGATGATVVVARDKAHASAGFQSPSGALQEQAKSNPGFVSLPDFVILPGGEPIFVDKALAGGVGVSGAPSGDIDDQCAKTGLAAIGLNS